jgi:hypothetical protein
MDGLPAVAKSVSLLQSVQTGSRIHAVSYLVFPGSDFPWGKTGRDAKLTTHLHIVLILRKSGAVTCIPPYAFIL